MNEGKPGDLRDTTTPEAMTQTIRELVLGAALDDKSSRQLTDWLLSNEVGDPLLRAGVPGDWKVADRTGNGGFGTRGIMAVIWPPQRTPVI
jgi:beta-lactamase class A/beta-lactamase class A CARB-5